MTAHLIVAMVLAFATMETPNGIPSQPGPAGETGRWQLTPEVRQARGRELKAAGVPVTDEAIATWHVKWIAQRLKVNGIIVTPFEIALAWNAGVTATVNGRAPKKSYEYAARFATIVDAAIK